MPSEWLPLSVCRSVLTSGSTAGPAEKAKTASIDIGDGAMQFVPGSPTYRERRWLLSGKQAGFRRWVPEVVLAAYLRTMDSMTGVRPDIDGCRVDVVQVVSPPAEELGAGWGHRTPGLSSNRRIRVLSQRLLPGETAVCSCRIHGFSLIRAIMFPKDARHGSREGCIWRGCGEAPTPMFYWTASCC